MPGAECDREMLRELADTYVEAQATGKPALVPLQPTHITEKTIDPWALPKAC